MRKKTRKTEKELQKKPEKKKRNWWPWGFSGAALVTLSYFGWEYWKSRKRALVYKEEAPKSESTAQNNSEYVPPFKESNIDLNEGDPDNSFPLKKGDKGEKVKLLQLSLIAKYGKSILPKYGADGDFGSEMVAALKKAGLSETISESTFNVLTGSTNDPSAIAKKIYEALGKMDIVTVLSQLRNIKDTSAYKAVSDAFQSYRVGGVRQTLVNAVLNSFPDERLKQMIRLAFSNMGLKYDGTKWSLSGFADVKYIITTRPGTVWKNPQTGVKVPAKMVLGKEIAKRGSFTVFENENRHYLIQNAFVTYYKPRS